MEQVNDVSISFKNHKKMLRNLVERIGYIFSSKLVEDFWKQHNIWKPELILRKAGP